MNITNIVISKTENTKLGQVVSKKLNKTYLILLVSSIMLLLFGGLGNISNHTFGNAFLGSTGWFEWIMISVATILGVILITYFIYNKKVRSDEPTDGELQALNLSAIWVGASGIFSIAFQYIVMASFFNSLVIDPINLEVKDSLFLTFSILTIFIMTAGFSLGLWWYFRSKNIETKKDDRTYAYLRNTGGTLLTGSFVIFVAAQMGLGSFGLDMSRTNIVDFTVDMFEEMFSTDPLSASAGSWDLVIRYTDLGAQILNDAGIDPSYIGKTFSEIAANHSEAEIGNLVGVMSQNVTEILATMRVAIVFEPKSAFFGVNENWQIYLLLGVMIALAHVPFMNIYIFKTKGECRTWNKGQKETVSQVLISVFVFTMVIYALDAWVIQYIANGTWNPGIHKHFDNMSSLTVDNYTGTGYYWTMFSAMIIVPGVLINGPLINKSKKIN